MTQFSYIKEIVKSGLENDQEKFKEALNELIEHAKKTKKINYALQLQSLLKDAIRQEQSKGPKLVGSHSYFTHFEDKELNEFVLEKVTSEYRFENLIVNEDVKEQLQFLIDEHRSKELIRKFNLPISNKVLFYGPSGCGKTLASYVIAGELEKMMYVINLGAIVSSKLGETSKNLAKVFRQATTEDCIIFIDEFDSLGKVRDYAQDHGEMKRIVNTILHLFDYLPQSSIVIAATNQIEMIDTALLRRFDVKLKLELPDKNKIKKLIELVLKNGNFSFDKKNAISTILKYAEGLSYYMIQKALIGAIKRSILDKNFSDNQSAVRISTSVWLDIIKQEKEKITN